jgi:hypothetical protein
MVIVAKHRLRDPLTRPVPDFADNWIFSYVEACIARTSRYERNPFDDPLAMRAVAVVG